MARITLGRRAVDLTQINEIRIVRRGFRRKIAGGVAIVALGVLALVVGEQWGLSLVARLGLFFGSMVIGGAFAGSAVAGQVCLDIEYQGGRVARVECISQLHADEMKADLLRRMQEQ